MTQANNETPAPLEKVYQQLASAGSIQKSRFLQFYENNMAVARAAYNDLKEASIVSPVGETDEIGEIPPVLDLTDFGMSFLISRGYTVRPRG